MQGGEENMKCRALLEETVTVLPNSGSFILVMIPGAEHLAKSGLVEPTRDTKKAFIVPGLVNLNRNYIFINILNTTTDPVTLYANQQVGNCVSFTESTNKIPVCTSVVHSGSSNNGGVSVPEYLVDLLERSSVHLDGEQEKSYKICSLNTKMSFPNPQMILVAQIQLNTG